MKKRIMFAIAAMMVLGLTIVVFAFNNTTNHTHNKAMNCCSKDKDSCPMKNKTESGDKKDCCDKPDCCCKGGGDSCPMKNQQKETSSQTVDMNNVTVVTSSEDCCQKGADCCKNGGACCKKKS